MSNHSIQVSVILPNYNTDKYIERAINSFLKQDYANKQLVIVDGKSTDNSHAIIQKYVSEHDNIIWSKDKDENVTDAINIGLKYCTGDFISFLASDVYYYEEDVFSCINFNYNLVPFDCIYFDHYFYYTFTKSIALHKCPNVPFNKNNLLQIGMIAGFDNVFISKKVYERFQLNPKYNLCSDWEFFLRITQENLLFFYKEKVCTVTVQDGNNLSMKYYDLQMQQVREVGTLYNTDKVRLYYEPVTPAYDKTLKGKIKRLIGRL